MARKRKTDRLSTVIGITTLDALLLDKLIAGLNNPPNQVLKVTRKSWASLAISDAFISAFGSDEFRAVKLKWIENFLGEPTKDF